MRMPEGIVCTHRNHAYCGFRPDLDALAAMVRHLQNIRLVGYSKASFDVARQERRGWPGFQKQDDRVVILVVLSGRPVRRRMQHREWPDGLTGTNPSDGDLPGL